MMGHTMSDVPGWVTVLVLVVYCVLETVTYGWVVVDIIIGGSWTIVVDSLTGGGWTIVVDILAWDSWTIVADVIAGSWASFSRLSVISEVSVDIRVWEVAS